MNPNSRTRSAKGSGQEERRKDFVDLVGKPSPEKCKMKVRPVVSHTKPLLGALDSLEQRKGSKWGHKEGHSGKAVLPS